ncbi:MAG: LysR family transcriptional regulator [Candidatus Eisenbacteria bacterium]|nr:LysR family transcriptional regulator [Candidatus Eisenbacteria bacterium]
MNDLAPLRAFLAVAREGGFSAAARALHLTQPTISMQIRRLEQELGERLFERTGKRARPTPAGFHLIGRAEEVVRAAENLADAARDLREVHGGDLQIGTTDVASIYVLPRAYRTFLGRHPSVNLSVTVDGTLPLLQSLRAGRIELAVATLPVSGDDLESTVVERDRLLPILPRRHPLAGRKRIRPEELAETPMITFKENSVTRREVDRAFGAAGVRPRVAMEISSPEAIKKLVEVGLGFAVLPERSVRAEIHAGRLASPVLTGLRLERRIGVIRPRGRYLSPAARAFLSILESD